MSRRPAKFRPRREGGTKMNVSAHRSIGPTSMPTVDSGPAQPGPRPPPKHLSARALTALVSQLTTGHPNPDAGQAPGPLDPYIRRALERTAVGSAVGSTIVTSLW